MIPILFDANTDDFTTNGLGRLSDCISCLVTEERNGLYELEMQYPITGVHYDLIEQGKIIVTSHDEQKDRQPFIIYCISRPISGIVTINAHHVSYNLSNVIISPFTASSVTDAFNQFKTQAMTDNPFAFWTDKSSGGSFKVEVPTSCRALLGGVQGSILDSFGGGEYKWDNYTVRLYAHRGTDSGVTIRYGKNLTNINETIDTMDLYNAVIPYWANNDDTVVYGSIVYGAGGIKQYAIWEDENGIPITDENNDTFQFEYYISQVRAMDLSNEFEEQPTVADLEARAQVILNSRAPWIPKENIKIDFVALWQTEEYKDIAPLERVQLCDTVSVYYSELGVNATAKVIKVVWNALTERYDSIELGDAKTSFADALQSEIRAETDEKLKQVPNISMMEEAIDHATNLITGGLGGHIVFLYDANGKPTDMLVMDTEDVATAVHVLRINVNGIGFSSSGVNGPYTSAWTLDGKFVADFITAGHLSANRIQGGTLTLGGAGNGNGVIVVYNASGAEIGRWDKDGLNATGDFTMEKTISSNTLLTQLGSVTYPDPYYVGYTRTTYGLSMKLNNKNQRIVGPKTDVQIWDDISFNSDWLKGASMRTYSITSLSPNMIFEETISDGFTGWSRFKYVNSSSGYQRKSCLYFGETGLYFNSPNLTNGGTSSIYPQMILHNRPDYNGSSLYIAAASDKYISFSTNAFYFESGSTTFQVDAQGVYYKGSRIHTASSSSKRYKHDITADISEDLDAHKLYELQMKQFVFNSDHILQYGDMAEKTIPGFIAEDVAEIYPAAVIHDEEGRVESWDERRIIPGMLKLIQEQHDEIEDLKKRLEKLETIVDTLIAR